MSDKQTSSCIDLSEIRKLDQLLTQCETSSCEHICRDCCAKLGSLEDITDQQVEEGVEELLVLDDSDAAILDDEDSDGVKSTEIVQEEQLENQDGCRMITDRRHGESENILVYLTSDCSGHYDAVNPSESVGEFDDDYDEVQVVVPLPRERLCRTETAPDSTHCMEPLPCARDLNRLTLNKTSLWICENCERINRRSRQVGSTKKHSLTINEKPIKLVRLEHKCSSENCLKHHQKGQPHQHHASSSLRKSLAEQHQRRLSSETVAGSDFRKKTVSTTKLSTQMMARRISCRIPDDLEAGAKEALLGSRFGSLHDKKLPEPVETVCENDYP